MLAPELAKACRGRIRGQCAVAELWCHWDFRDIVGSLREQGALTGGDGFFRKVGQR